MNPRVTAALFFVLLILGGAYWYTEIYRAEQVAEVERLEKRLFPFEDLNLVTRITIDRPGSDLIVAERREQNGEETWMITEPLLLNVDPVEFDALLTGIAEGEQDRVLDNPTALSAYSLDPPRATVTVMAEDGEDGSQRVASILVGGENPSQSMTYAQFPDTNSVLLVPERFGRGLKKSLFELRDKVVYAADWENVRAITIKPRPNDEEAPAAIRLEKRGPQEWEMVAPETIRADFNEIGKLETRLTEIQALSFERENATPEDLTDYGFDEPTMVVEVEYDEGSGIPKETITFGRYDGTLDQYYFQGFDKTKISLVGENNFRTFDVEPGDLRDRRMIPYVANDVARLRLHNDFGSSVLNQESDVWFFEGVDERRVGERAVVSELINYFKRTEASEYRPVPDENIDYGFDDPQATLTLILREGKSDQQVTLLFGDQAPGDNFVYARASEKGGVFFMPLEAYTKVMRTPFDLRDKTIFDYQPHDIKRVSWQSPQGTTVFSRPTKDDDWTVEGAPDLELDQEKIRKLFIDYNTIDMRRIIEEDSSQADLGRFGLNDPGFVIKAWTNEGATDDDQPFEELHIGTELPNDGQYYVHSVPRGKVATIDRRYVADFVRDVVDYVVVPDAEVTE